MHIAQMRAGALPFPRILYFSDLRLYLYVSVFVALDLSVSWFCHIIHPLAGPTLLPLFFFVLLAGILFGWRAGILIGLLTPLFSYALSGMPLPQILPRIIIEASVYGLAAGILHGRFSFAVFPSLVAAIIAGRLAAFMLMALSLGLSHSAELTWEAAQSGWPGIFIQVLFLPLIVVLLKRISSGSHHAEG